MTKHAHSPLSHPKPKHLRFQWMISEGLKTRNVTLIGSSWGWRSLTAALRIFWIQAHQFMLVIWGARLLFISSCYSWWLLIRWAFLLVLIYRFALRSLNFIYEISFDECGIILETKGDYLGSCVLNHQWMGIRNKLGCFRSNYKQKTNTNFEIGSWFN